MINYELIGEATLHPIQRCVLEAMTKDAALTSPKKLSDFLGKPLPTVSYHMRILSGTEKHSPFRKRPLLKLLRTEPRRGAMEHIYGLTKVATR